eukprot:scaffold205751_cov18-Tisochrysis_lutea.AAC.1
MDDASDHAPFQPTTGNLKTLKKELEWDLRNIERFGGRADQWPFRVIKQLDILRQRYKDLWTNAIMDDSRLVEVVLSGDALDWWLFEYRFKTWDDFKVDFTH